ncbi:MAG: iron-containing alcohol dehydrogenase [Phycisphaerae bacterium]|nr:iron-containing alcohol dehydrogenase [Phycisphaerae bacterium]NIP56086.1 iron-containing alcohol dehydrogenase [Phycisphaerae bacterium]NIS54613.1 iron-containing alcohol dehydrogenase [Phycisphaerae bacterium]NIU12222.1 iron-containing alcohol dehydrogenase [Phycisphaerae bacterium]NIU60071.1 iron-containing alcohol dehydrogenase [Phycisphaerae bacterium]
MDCELDIPSRVIIGADTRLRVAQEVRNLEWSRVLIVSDPFHEETERIKEIAQLLSKADLKVSTYTGVTDEPDTEMVGRGFQQFQADKCDGTVALGGGSVIDTAKTISVLARNEDVYENLMGIDNVARLGAGVIALPTTSGTGSEASKVVVISDLQSRIKMTGRSRAYVPSVAILDYKLTMSMPKSLTAAVGIDALTHAMEAYVSRQACDFTDLLALSAVKLIWSSIRQAWYNSTDENARQNMLIGSFQAGIAFSNASVGLVHSMSEPIGACFHVPHGLSNAMLLPAVTKFSVDGAPSRYAAIARCVDLADDSTPDEECCRILVNELHQLIRELEIPSPKSFGIDKNSYEVNIEKMANDASVAGSTGNNPVIPTVDQIKDIYCCSYDS